MCAYYLVAATLIAKTLFSTANNAYIYSITFVITSLSLSYYFQDLYLSKWKRVVAVVCGGATLIYYLRSLQENDILFDSLGFVITSTGVVVLIFLYFHQIFTNVTEEELFLNFDFWFICSQLIYHLGSFGVFLTFQRLTERVITEKNYELTFRNMLTYLWGIHNVLLFLGSILTGGGLLWIAYRRRSLLS
jgi:hypothetical protein